MDLKKFFVGRAIGLIMLLIIIGIVGGFLVFNNYLYKEKQGENIVPTDSVQPQDTMGAPVFMWKYEKDDSFNLDGNLQTNVFLEVKYPNGEIQSKLIDTTPSGCNDLPDAEKDSVPYSTNIQCYYAGLGYKYKITKGEKSYLVERKTFEEASPDYDPPSTEYKVVSEFPFFIK